MTSANPTMTEIAAAAQRAHAKSLIVEPVWDSYRERSAWTVINPKSGSIHHVYVNAHNRLICDCEARTYCCCRAAVREWIEADVKAHAAANAQRAAQQLQREAARDAATLARPAERAFSIFKCE